MSFFDTYKQKFHSQWGEEGVILEILKRLEINPQNKWMCEFGAWDGKHLSNTFNLIKINNLKLYLLKVIIIDIMIC